MSRPVDPVPGDVVGVPWATQLTDYTSTKWRYVSMGWAATLAGVSPPALATIVEWEITQLPANDSAVVAALLAPRMIDTSGAPGSMALNLVHIGGTIAGYAFSDGVANKGGGAGATIVKVGGTNGRSAKWQVTGVLGGGGVGAARAWCWCLGYFVCEDVAQMLAKDDIDPIPDPPWPIAAVDDEVVIGA